MEEKGKGNEKKVGRKRRRRGKETKRRRDGKWRMRVRENDERQHEGLLCATPPLYRPSMSAPN